MYCPLRFHSLRGKSAHMVYCRKAKKKKYATAVHSFTKTLMIESLNSGDHFNSFERGHSFNVSLLQKEGIGRSGKTELTPFESEEHDDNDDDIRWDDEVDEIPYAHDDYLSSDENDGLDQFGDHDEDNDGSVGDEFYEPTSASASYNELRQKYHRLKHTMPPSQQRESSISTNVDVDLINVIPPSTDCFINLLKILKRHRVDKMLFDELVEWAFHWYANDPLVFHQKSKKWSRSNLIDHLS